jgi:phosphatidate cytidylyltransferase
VAVFRLARRVEKRLGPGRLAGADCDLGRGRAASGPLAVFAPGPDGHRLDRRFTAYFAGRRFGKRKLAPSISPGKTWEGVYGALVAVAVYALVLLAFAEGAGYSVPIFPSGAIVWVALVLALAGVSIVGDLFESQLKRHHGVKDSGKLLPGHGGVLDRIDALLAALPPAALISHYLIR